MKKCKTCEWYEAASKTMGICEIHNRSAGTEDMACNKYGRKWRLPRLFGWSLAGLIGLVLWICIILSVVFMVRQCSAFQWFLFSGYYETSNWANGELNTAFYKLEMPDNLPKMIDLGNIRVVIAQHCDQVPGWTPPKGAVGWADSRLGVLCIEGRISKGKIVLQPFNAGHELWHLIQHRDSGIANPDKPY
jgi:hypothetical protein